MKLAEQLKTGLNVPWFLMIITQQTFTEWSMMQILYQKILDTAANYIKLYCY